MKKQLSLRYPGLFVVSDTASLKAQKYYNGLNKLVLIALILGAFFGALQSGNKAYLVTSGLLLVLGIGLTIILMAIKFEKKWYEGRAIAESVKTLSWKYIMRSEPYYTELTEKEADEKLIESFKALIGQRKEYYSLIGEDFTKHEHITESMRQIRSLNLKDRLDFYSKHRLKEQKEWYSNKALDNKTSKRISFGLIIALLLLAIGCLFLDYFNLIQITLTPVIITVASTIIAWMQLKRYQELTLSYSITATELSMIQNKANHVKSQDDLQEYVEDAERAISREHTLWLARRENTELFR